MFSLLLKELIFIFYLDVRVFLWTGRFVVFSWTLWSWVYLNRQKVIQVYTFLYAGDIDLLCVRLTFLKLTDKCSDAVLMQAKILNKWSCTSMSNAKMRKWKTSAIFVSNDVIKVHKMCLLTCYKQDHGRSPVHQHSWAINCELFRLVK